LEYGAACGRFVVDDSNKHAMCVDRSFSSALSDLPDPWKPHTQETDFTEIFDALHPDVENTPTSNHMFPYRGVKRQNSISNRLFGRQ
jgi:hypothetical protein